jgi:tetratricopeptide (TPR) repeat protein
MADAKPVLLPGSTSEAVLVKRVWACCALLFLFTLLLYSRTLHYGFINYDDPAYVTRNAQVQQGLSLANVGWALTSTSEANWHPLTWLSHMADVTFFGANPAGHHLTSILFHACNAALLLLLLYSATGYLGRSLLVAVLFAAHPLNVESVVWIAERKSVVSTLFFFLAIGAYGIYVRRKSAVSYAVVVVLFALGLMAKPMVITLPCLLLLLDYWPLNRIPVPRKAGAAGEILGSVEKCFVEKLPLFALSLGSVVITIIAQHRGGAIGETVLLPLRYRVENAIYSYAAYIAKAILPVHLAVFYPHPEGRLRLWLVVACTLLLAAFSIICWRWRERRYLLTGWSWYLVALVPAIGIVQVGRQGMADRYAYIPLIGIFVAAVWAAAEVLGSRISATLLAALSAGIVLAYASVSLVQINYWKNSYVLFEHAVAVTRENGTAELNLGEALTEQGQSGLAEPHFRNAVRYSPDLGVAHYDLATILQRQDRTDEALDQYMLALPRMSDPLELAQTHNNLGVLYKERGEYVKALEQFQLAVQINPNEVNSYLGMGLVQFELGQTDRALASFTRAGQLAPSPLAWFWIGRCREARGENDLAIQAYQLTLRMAPQFAEAQTRLTILQQESR